MLRKPRHAGALTGLPSWCPIPVYFFDELSEILPSPHWRCLLTLWRLTLGWKKSGDYISLGGLGRRANVSRRIAAEALGWLRAADLVCIEKRRGTRGMNFVRIVTDYDPINVTSALRALVEQSKSKRASRESGKNRATQRTRTSAPNALGLVHRVHPLTDTSTNTHKTDAGNRGVAPSCSREILKTIPPLMSEAEFAERRKLLLKQAERLEATR